MSKLGIVALSLSGMLLLASFILMAVTKAEREKAGEVRSNVVNIQDAPRHPVTEEMAERALNLAASEAPDFELPTSEGGSFHLLEALNEKPVLVIMTKDGCPCSIESQPFFTTLAMHYGEKLTTIGVLDGNRTVADQYKTSFSLPYDMAYSESTDFFVRYKSKQSVFHYLIGQDGKLVKVWPGYSRASLVELNDLLAELTGIEPAVFEHFEMAPAEMTSGCYFFTDVAAPEPSW